MTVAVPDQLLTSEHEKQNRRDEAAASLVAQSVKNLPAVQETWFWSLGREDPLEKGMATRSSFLAWRNPRAEEPRVHGVAKRHDWTDLAGEMKLDSWQDTEKIVNLDNLKTE